MLPPGHRAALEDMGFCVPECVKQLDIRKVIVSVVTGAGAIYLCYKAIKTGLRCQPPFCSNTPICIARECLVPGERLHPQTHLLLGKAHRCHQPSI